MNISQDILKQRISSLVPPRNSRNKKASKDDNSTSSSSSSRKKKEQDKVITIESSDSENNSNITIIHEERKSEKPKRFSFSYPKTESKPIPKKNSLTSKVITIEDSDDDVKISSIKSTSAPASSSSSKSNIIIDSSSSNSNTKGEAIVISDNENRTIKKNKVNNNDIVILDTNNNNIDSENSIEIKGEEDDDSKNSIEIKGGEEDDSKNLIEIKGDDDEEEEEEEENYIGFESSESEEEGKKENDMEEEDYRRKRRRNYEVHSRDILTPISVPPWIIEGKKYSEFGPQMLHEEILDFVKYILPTPEEKYMREYALKKVSDVILDLYPGTIIKTFGSYRTNLYLPTSDIDVVIFNEDLSVPLCLFGLEEAIEDADIASKIEVIDKARIPIIKLVEKETGYHFDISVNVESGINSAKIMEKFIESSGYGQAIVALVLVIKQFLAQRYMNEVYSGGLGSYSVFILVTNFIMMHPCVQNKQILPQENLGVLLLEFLEMFGRVFNYEDVGLGISLKKGAYYYRKTDKDRYNYNRPRLLSIEDPEDHENDVTKNSFAVSKIMQAFDQAFATISGKMCAQYTRVQPDYKDELERERQRYKRRKNNNQPKHKRFNDDSNTEEENSFNFIEPYIRQCKSFLGSVIWIQKETELHRQRIRELFHELNP